MKISLVLQAIDRASAPIRKVAESTRAFGRTTNEAVGGSTRLSAGLANLRTRIGALVSGPASMKVLERASYGVGYALGSVARAAGRLALGGVGVATAGLTALFGYLTFGVLSTGAKFELFQAQLQTLDGTAAKAKESLAWVAKFAADTPYEIE